MELEDLKEQLESVLVIEQMMNDVDYSHLSFDIEKNAVILYRELIKFDTNVARKFKMVTISNDPNGSYRIAFETFSKGGLSFEKVREGMMAFIVGEDQKKIMKKLVSK